MGRAQAVDGAREELHLGGTARQHVLAQARHAGRIQVVDDVEPVGHIIVGERDAAGPAHGGHLPHGGDHGLARLAGDVDAVKAAVVDGAGLVHPHIADELAPQLMLDVRGHDEGLLDGGEPFRDTSEVRPLGRILGVANAKGHHAHAAGGYYRAHLARIHLLGDAQKHAVPAEALREHLFARDAVEHRDDGGVQADERR